MTGSPETLDITVLVGVLVLAGALIAPCLRLPVPLAMLFLGVLAGFIPQVRDIHLPSEAVLVLFLPPLLFWESLTTSLREIRRDLRGILLLSTLLVVATAFGIAGIGTALGMSFGAALILGAALAPTDATAVAAMARTLPHRNMTLLRAESLINDGTALVLYTLAVGVTIGQETYSEWAITGLVALAYLGGAAVGAAAGRLSTLLLRRLPDPILNNVALVLIPFVAFLAAELIHASGVIAVVVAGLILSQSGPRVSTPQSRQQTFGFWSLTTFILNGALFVLIGIEAQSSLRAVPAEQIVPLLILTVVAWAALVVIRFAFQMVSVSLIRALDRRPSQRQRRMPHRARVVSAVAGFRGAVSLAVALAVPTALATGQPFPGRDQIVFIAAGVVFLSLVIQGMLLPASIRWASFAPDTTVDDELALAQEKSTRQALANMPDVAARLGVSEQVRDQMLEEYRQHLAVLAADPRIDDEQQLLEHDRDYARLRLALLEHKRDVVIDLRDDRTISDTTLRMMQARLDREALRITQPEILE
jgi:CPA1 family monovalent cation:H+ antiporter